MGYYLAFGQDKHFSRLLKSLSNMVNLGTLFLERTVFEMGDETTEAKVELCVDFICETIGIVL